MHIPFGIAAFLWAVSGLFAVSDNVAISFITAFFAFLTSAVGAFFAYKTHVLAKQNTGRLEKVEKLTEEAGPGLTEVFGNKFPEAGTKK